MFIYKLVLGSLLWSATTNISLFETYRLMPGESVSEKVARFAPNALLQISAQGLGLLTGFAIMGVSVSPIGWAALGASAITAIFMIIHQNKHNPRAVAIQLASAVGIYALAILNGITWACTPKTWETVRDDSNPFFLITFGIMLPPIAIAFLAIGSVWFAYRPPPQRQQPQPEERPILRRAAQAQDIVPQIVQNPYDPFDLRALPEIPSFLHDDPQLRRVPCAIERTPARDPVGDPDGVHIYDRQNILKWLRVGRLISPFTNRRLTPQMLIEKPALKKFVEDRLQFISDGLRTLATELEHIPIDSNLEAMVEAETPGVLE